MLLSKCECLHVFLQKVSIVQTNSTAPKHTINCCSNLFFNRIMPSHFAWHVVTCWWNHTTFNAVEFCKFGTKTVQNYKTGRCLTECSVANFIVLELTTVRPMMDDVADGQQILSEHLRLYFAPHATILFVMYPKSQKHRFPLKTIFWSKNRFSSKSTKTHSQNKQHCGLSPRFSSYSSCFL